MDGFFIVDKPQGMTSQTVCSKIKHKFGNIKCGHNGTLDPMTTGVMVVGVGKATKLLNYFNTDEKTYVTTIVFGYDSDTLDIYGKITKEINMDVKLDSLDIALEEMKKMTKQVPPIYSAIKVSGRKLLDYAKKNVEVEIKERDIEIIDLKRISDLRFIDNHFEVDLELKVSKGFYVRSFARDLGEKLGGIAIMKSLRRIASSRFTEEMAIPLAKIIDEDIKPLNITDVFNYRIIEANSRILKYILNGVTIYRFNLIKDCKLKDIDNLDYFYFSYNGKLISLYAKSEDCYRPILKLCEDI